MKTIRNLEAMQSMVHYDTTVRKPHRVMLQGLAGMWRPAKTFPTKIVVDNRGMLKYPYAYQAELGTHAAPFILSLGRNQYQFHKLPGTAGMQIFYDVGYSETSREQREFYHQHSPDFCSYTFPAAPMCSATFIESPSSIVLNGGMLPAVSSLRLLCEEARLRIQITCNTKASADPSSQMDTVIGSAYIFVYSGEKILSTMPDFLVRKDFSKRRIVIRR